MQSLAGVAQLPAEVNGNRVLHSPGHLGKPQAVLARCARWSPKLCSQQVEEEQPEASNFPFGRLLRRAVKSLHATACPLGLRVLLSVGWPNGDYIV